MYELVVHDDATQDLREILSRDKASGVRLTAFIRELRDSQDLLDRLSRIGFGGRPARPVPRGATFNVGMWSAAQNKGMNLWRVRSFAPEALGYRIIYAFCPPDRYTILAIAEKADENDENDTRFDYSLSHDRSIRIFRAYQQLFDL